MTSRLLRLSGRVLPNPGDDFVRTARPASFEMERCAFDELLLLFFWFIAILLAMMSMGVLSFATGDLGLTVGQAFAWACFAGACVHGVRFLVAQRLGRRTERLYRREHGMSSAQAAAMGHEVQAVRYGLPSWITRSTDLDLLLQLLFGICVVLSTRG